MKDLLLLHQSEILHYRIAIYNKFAAHLLKRGWRLTVIADSVPADSPHSIEFELRIEAPSLLSRIKIIREIEPRAVIFFVNLKERYLFPTLFYCKAKRIPAIYWGHGVDLEDKRAYLKNILYRVEHVLFDALVLYAEWLRQYVNPRHHSKIFIANNTIDTSLLVRSGYSKETLRHKLGVRTRKNIIFVGRLQKRKRIDLLLQAFDLLGDHDIGLILVGPDTEGIACSVCNDRVRWVGPKFGRELAEYMELADVYCMPGHVGLSIVDAMHYGLPFVTTDVDHAPEIGFLQDGITGFIVKSESPKALANELRNLLNNDALREQMSRNAESVIQAQGSLSMMFSGFDRSLSWVETTQGGGTHWRSK